MSSREFASIAPVIVVASALCALLCAVAVDGQQRSALFSAVQSAAGRTQCSPLPPLVTLSARSRIECSLRCAGQAGCVAFNLRANNAECDLFNATTTNNTLSVLGCSLYEVG